MICAFVFFISLLDDMNRASYKNKCSETEEGKGKIHRKLTKIATTIIFFRSGDQKNKEI